MARTIRTKIYKFNELSKEAQQNAVQLNAYDEEFYSADEVIQSLKGFAKHFDSEVKDYEIDWLETTMYPRVEFDVSEMEEPEIKKRIKQMGSYDKKTLKGHGDCKFTGVCFDEDAADGARMAYFEGVMDLNEILQAGAKSLLKAAKTDYEYQLSFAGFKEMAESNEYEFLNDGKRY